MLGSEGSVSQLRRCQKWYVQSQNIKFQRNFSNTSLTLAVQYSANFIISKSSEIFLRQQMRFLVVNALEIILSIMVDCDHHEYSILMEVWTSRSYNLVSLWSRLPRRYSRIYSVCSTLSSYQPPSVCESRGTCWSNLEISTQCQTSILS